MNWIESNLEKSRVASDTVRLTLGVLRRTSSNDALGEIEGYKGPLSHLGIKYGAETIAMYYAAKANPVPSVMRSIRAMYPRRIAVIEELVETEKTKLQARNSVGR